MPRQKIPTALILMIYLLQTPSIADDEKGICDSMAEQLGMKAVWNRTSQTGKIGIGIAAIGLGLAAWLAGPGEDQRKREWQKHARGDAARYIEDKKLLREDAQWYIGHALPNLTAGEMFEFVCFWNGRKIQEEGSEAVIRLDYPDGVLKDKTNFIKEFFSAKAKREGRPSKLFIEILEQHFEALFKATHWVPNDMDELVRMTVSDFEKSRKEKSRQ